MKTLLHVLRCCVIVLSLPLAAAPLSSLISYQGNRSENGQPANGTYDLRLALYDAGEGGTLAGSTLTNANVKWDQPVRRARGD